MSYAIYTTRGFVLGSAPSGEASKVYSLYTEDFGLVAAKAQGARLLQSKLRYNLEEFSFGTFSIVRGKEVWRITGAEKNEEPREGRLLRARILALVRRLVHGEEANPELFNALLLLFDGKGYAEKERATAFESLVLVLVLSSLGYIDARSILGKSANIVSLSDLDLVESKKKEIVREINKSLKETQL